MRTIKPRVTAPVGQQDPCLHELGQQALKGPGFGALPSTESAGQARLESPSRRRWETTSVSWPATHHRHFYVQEAPGSLELPAAELLLECLNREEQEGA